MEELKQPTFCVATLGCKVNKSDTENIQQTLTAEGFKAVPFEAGADVYVINTCTVTAKSDFQSRQLVRRALNRNKQAQVIVTGCYAQIDFEELKQLPGVNCVVRNIEKDKILDYITPLLKELGQKALASGSVLNGDNKNRFTRAFLKIQDGCDAACSYCIVPRARGKSRSRPIEEILPDADQLITRGFKEIVLTGIHIGCYGLDLSPQTNLAQLLRDICSLEGLGRIRLSSIEPTEFSRKIIEVIRKNEKICRHFHVPLQSGDNEILRAMNRSYCFEEYQRLIWRLRRTFPQAAIGCDVMVGFPGETDEHFQITYSRLARLPLTYFHVFSYSKRPDTKAAQMPDQVNGNKIKIRGQKLRDLGEQKKLDFYMSQIGQTRPSLVLNQRDAEKKYLVGISDNYINIQIPDKEELINKLLNLRITDVNEKRVLGKVV